jgi:PleD family two-component response regulator
MEGRGMRSRHRILVAAQPAAWPVLKNLLEELADLVPVHGVTEAMQVLEQDPAGIDLIICTLTFSDHRMLEFLLQVKGNPKTSAIPFLVCRTLVGRLSEELVVRMGALARHFEADFINLPRFPADEARKELSAVVTKCFASNRRSPNR